MNRYNSVVRLKSFYTLQEDIGVIQNLQYFDLKITNDEVIKVLRCLNLYC